jgi:hypothetical protein
MTTPPSDLHRDDLERLLEGQGGDPPSPHLHRLAHLLAAAAAPSRPHELRGEHAARDAFRAARDHPVAARRVRSRAAIAGSRAAKIAAAILAITSAGTTAVAMATGSVPHFLVRTQSPVPSAAPAPESPSRGAERHYVLPAPRAVTPPSTGRSPGPAIPTASSGGVTSPPESPSVTVAPPPLTGLCRDYLAIPEPRRRQAMKDPKFTPLVSPAGGKGRVDAYCGQLLTSLSPSPAPPTSSPSPEVSPSEAGPDQLPVAG